MLNLTPLNSVVVVVDWQERLAAVMPPEIHAHNLDKARILLEGARAAGVPVLVTEQYPQGLGVTVSPLAELIGETTRIEKRDFSCADVPAFMDQLESTRRSHVVLTGMEAHVCVYQTARGLVEEGYVVHIPLDAVVSRRTGDYRAAEVLYATLGAIATSVETVLFDWVGRGEGPLFKAVSRLVR